MKLNKSNSIIYKIKIEYMNYRKKKGELAYLVQRFYIKSSMFLKNDFDRTRDKYNEILHLSRLIGSEEYELQVKYFDRHKRKFKDMRNRIRYNYIGRYLADPKCEPVFMVFDHFISCSSIADTGNVIRFLKNSLRELS